MCVSQSKYALRSFVRCRQKPFASHSFCYVHQIGQIEDKHTHTHTYHTQNIIHCLQCIKSLRYQERFRELQEDQFIKLLLSFSDSVITAPITTLLPPAATRSHLSQVPSVADRLKHLQQTLMQFFFGSFIFTLFNYNTTLGLVAQR